MLLWELLSSRKIGDGSRGAFESKVDVAVPIGLLYSLSMEASVCRPVLLFSICSMAYSKPI